MPYVSLQVVVTETIEIPEDKYEEVKGKLKSGEIEDRFELMEATGNEFEFEYDTIEVLNSRDGTPVLEVFENEKMTSCVFSKNSFK